MTRREKKFFCIGMELLIHYSRAVNKKELKALLPMIDNFMPITPETTKLIDELTQTYPELIRRLNGSLVEK